MEFLEGERQFVGIWVEAWNEEDSIGLCGGLVHTQLYGHRQRPKETTVKPQDIMSTTPGSQETKSHTEKVKSERKVNWRH